MVNFILSNVNFFRCIFSQSTIGHQHYERVLASNDNNVSFMLRKKQSHGPYIALKRRIRRNLYYCLFSTIHMWDRGTNESWWWYWLLGKKTLWNWVMIQLWSLAISNLKPWAAPFHLSEGVLLIVLNTGRDISIWYEHIWSSIIHIGHKYDIYN